MNQGVVRGYDFGGTFDPYKDVDISILLTSRDRPVLLGRYLERLEKTCSRPDRIELLIKLDSDDSHLNRYMSLVDLIGQRGIRHRILVYPPFHGYWSGFMFLNDLAKLASGKMMWLQADDLRISGGDWFAEFMNTRDKYFKDNIYIIGVSTDTHGRSGIRGNHAPCLTREWYEVLGYISPSPQVDSWLHHLARRLRREIYTPIWFSHSREAGSKAVVNQGWMKAERRQAIVRHIDRLIPHFEAATGETAMTQDELIEFVKKKAQEQ